MLKAVSARRGMPFEWSFLLDALQTERDQGITIDTTQIRFRTGSRDVVLIDAPGHAEFLRNMITGASQADGAVLIIDALEGVRDQTRRHGYLLHLLGVKQVAVVVNKMDRVDFSAARFQRDQRRDFRASDRPRRHAVGGDSDFGARRRRRRRAHAADRLVQRPDRGRGARCAGAGAAAGAACAAAAGAGDLQIRRPPHCRRPHRIRQPRAPATRSSSCPRARSRRSEPSRAGRLTPVDGTQTAGRSVGITLDRELFIERGDVIAHVGDSPRDTRRIRARIFWLHDKPLATGDSILVRLGTRETRATVVAIEKAVDPGELSSVETKSIARNHVGEIDISLAQPLAADPYTDNPRTGRLVIEVNGRIAGGGLVLSVDAGQRAVPVDIVPVESALAPRRAFGALSPQRRGGLADRPAGLRQIDAGARAGAPAVRQWRLADAAGRRYVARRPQWRSRLLARRTAAKTSAGSPKSPPISRATGISPSSPRSRPRARIAPRRAASPTPRSARSMSRRRPRSARAAIPRAITPRRAPARCTPSPASATITSRRPRAN